MNNIKKIILALSIITAGSINLLVAGNASNSQKKSEGGVCSGPSECESGICTDKIYRKIKGCGSSMECQGGQYCNDRNLCTKRSKNNHSCIKNHECESNNCTGSSGTKTCQAK